VAEETNEAGSVVYCPGCNMRFRMDAEHEMCPRCGMSVLWEQEFSENDPTQLWRREEDETPTVRDKNDEDLRHLVGQTLGVYRCEGFLGRGGMGWVFEAFHSDLHRRCALKLMSPSLFARDRESLARFMNEARAAAALVHPNVVTTHALGEHEGLHFLEMELVRGQSLQHALRSGRLSPLRSGAIAMGIASGLAAAHREHILHRDLKPDNVLMTLRGIPKIGDFGLAKRVVRAGRASANDELVGTPHYMAPELFSGMPATPASDVYALGICLFRMLTGRLPFTASSLDELIAEVTQAPLPDIRREVSEVSLEMAECVNLLLAKSPENRPRDGIEAFQLLQSILGQARDLESLVQEALDDGGMTERVRTAKGYEVTVRLPDGRRQRVYIETSEHAATDRLLLIFTNCCVADPSYYEEALRMNAKVSHGALAIRNIGGEPHFVMVDTYPRATVDAEEIRRSVFELAMQADAVEQLLSDEDAH